MPEYILSSFGWNSYERSLGRTPNENGEFPLENPSDGSINQVFANTSDGLLGLTVTDFRIPGILETQLVFDERGEAETTLTTHHALSAKLGENLKIVRQRFHLDTK